MKNLVDLHAHLLPGLDDGPQDLQGSLKMLEALEEMGFSHVFATPHHRLYSWEGIEPETVENAVDVIMTYPHFSGRKGQTYMLYHRSGYVSMNGYDQLKKSVKRLVTQEVSNRGLLPRQTRYEHVKPQKVGQIWAEDFTELTVYGVCGR